MFKCRCEDTGSLPAIKEFMSLVEKTASGGILDFTHLQTDPFMEHWNKLCIIEYVEDKADYRFKLWGTELTRLFETDPTNKMMAMVYPDENTKTSGIFIPTRSRKHK